MKQFTLSAGEKLKSRKQIGLVFNKGRHFNLPSLRVSWIMEDGPAEEPLQAGVGASGRHFKKAVHRNRIKRLLREGWRLQKLPLKEALKNRNRKLSVFIIYNGRELPQMPMVMERMKEVIDTLIKQVHESHTEDS